MEKITMKYEAGRLTALSSSSMTMGYITFPQIRKGLVNVDRLQILPEYRGRGVEAMLMDALLAHLEQQDVKAALTSSKVQRYAAEHPEWKAVLPESMHMTAH